MAANRDTDKVETVAIELRLDRIPPAATTTSCVLPKDADSRPIRLVIMLSGDKLARPEAHQVPAPTRHHFELRRDGERRQLRSMWWHC